jgi:hypothetical protein
MKMNREGATHIFKKLEKKLTCRLRLFFLCSCLPHLGQLTLMVPPELLLLSALGGSRRIFIPFVFKRGQILCWKAAIQA